MSVYKPGSAMQARPTALEDNLVPFICKLFVLYVMAVYGNSVLDVKRAFTMLAWVYFIEGLNILGIFAFAISGAVAGIERRADIFGVLVLSFAASCCGGILRDLMIGAVPPDNIRAWQPLAASLSAGALTFWFFPIVNKLNNPVQFFDAIGLGFFTALGSAKALAFGIIPVWAVILGMVTGVGGGIVRDVLLARVPTILQADIYATASLAGAIVVVVGIYSKLVPAEIAMGLGAMLCIGLRLIALRRKWHMPVSRYGK